MISRRSATTLIAFVSCLLALSPACRRARPPQLLLLISVDTLRADHLGAYGGGLGLTPRLDRLAAESTVFETTYAPASFTLPSLSALLTSRYPEEVGITGNSTVLAPEAPSLAGMLKSRGWRTAAVVSNYVLRPASGFGAGFETYNATFPQREAVRPVPERNAPETTAAALRALDALRDTGSHTLFLWVHYQDPHGPYAPAETERARYLEAERKAPDANRLLRAATTESGAGAIPRYQYLEGHNDPAFYRAGYDAEVAFVDKWIGTLLDGVTERGLAQTALVVFTADHGEGMGENDYWFAHGDHLTDPLVRVPLIVHIPGRTPERRRDTAALLDVVPTLAAQLALPAPPGSRGRDLFAASAPRDSSTIYLTTLRVSETPRRGIVSRGYKYLLTQEQKQKEQLFRLGDETHDLAAEKPEELTRLRKELAAALASLRKLNTSEQAMSPEDCEKLKTLGYVEGC
jgi:arylsulfatase